MTKTIRFLIVLILSGLFFNGCAPKALPMSKSQVLDITKGDSFEPAYYAYFGTVSYRCDRMSPQKIKEIKLIWENGTLGSFELYDYTKDSYLFKTYFGKSAKIKHVTDSLSDFQVFERREDCMRFANFVGYGNSIDVNIH